MSGAEAVASRVAAVQARIAAAARRAGREPGEIRLVAAAKRKPARDVVAAVRAGVRQVGESYVQEAQAKIPEVKALLEPYGLDPPEWHMIGRLQRNKAREAVECFDLVESADRLELLRELDRRARSAGRRLAVLLQVNVSDEPQKAGAAPEALPELLAACCALPHLRVCGLMAIPAAASKPEASRPAFARLRELRERLGRAPGGEALEQLSMGMSTDFEVAIEEGATMVRVGTAIFGPREETR